MKYFLYWFRYLYCGLCNILFIFIFFYIFRLNSKSRVKGGIELSTGFMFLGPDIGFCLIFT